MIIYKTEAEIALMKEAALLVSKTLTEVAKVLKPGMTTMQISIPCRWSPRHGRPVPGADADCPGDRAAR